jgi:hypothetical protein
MTATPESLTLRGIFRDPTKDRIEELIAPSNLNIDNLLSYVRDVANHCGLPATCPVTKNNNGIDTV